MKAQRHKPVLYRRVAFLALWSAVSAGEAVHAQIATTWLAALGTWSDSTNWTNHTVPNNNSPPGFTYNAILSDTMGGAPAIALIDRSEVSISNLSIAVNDQVQIFEGTLNLAGVAGSGSINNMGSVVVMANATDAALNMNAASILLTGGGKVYLTGLQTPVLAGNGAATLVNVNNTIDGFGRLGDNRLRIINAGTIVASGAPLVIDPSPAGMLSGGEFRTIAGGQLIFSGAGGGTFDCLAAPVTVHWTGALVFADAPVVHIGNINLDALWTIDGGAAMTGRVDGTGTILQTAGNTGVARFRVNGFRLLAGDLAIMPDERGNNTSLVAGGTFSIGAGARLDIGDAGLAIDYSGGSPINTVHALVMSGRAGGSWTGPGITSSQAAAFGGAVVGYADTATLGAFNFRGIPVDNTTVVVRCTLPGDANCDGTVSIGDFAILAQNFNRGSGFRWYQGDFSYDGKVNLTDFSLLASQFNQTVASSARPADVPEPVNALLIWAPMVLCRIRRRR